MMLDSCILIDISRRNEAALDFVRNLRDVPKISAMTVTEVLRGVRNMREKLLFETLFNQWQIIPVTFDISVLAAELLKKHGASHGMDIVDAIIAASAAVNLRHLI